MIIIAGLGNPGKKFIGTRHNVGFIFLDHIKKTGDFSPWKKNESFFSEISSGNIFEKNIMLVKPMTFMNNSGKSIKKIFLKNGLEAQDLWVIQDEISLPVGTIKMTKNHGSAGHKGIESIISSIKTKDFLRFRVGIGAMGAKDKKDFVLKNFGKTDLKTLNSSKEKLIYILEIALRENIQKAMTECNKKE